VHRNDAVGVQQAAFAHHCNAAWRLLTGEEEVLMAEREIRERDILVASNEYAYVQDLTKGDIVLYVGPTKISLSNTERLVELRGERFVPARGEDATAGVQSFVSASSSQYVMLDNPAQESERATPEKGGNAAIPLLAGRRVVLPGPATFPLWPGQRATVIDGHRLGEDEYLVVRAYDAIEASDVLIGTEWVIRGADVSFYVPQTGVEVVADGARYVRRARRLHAGMGLHLRVVKAFVADADHQLPAGAYGAGQDVFLSGSSGYFFPDAHLEVVGEVSAIYLADHEGLYVREIANGHIATITGPQTFLPDPTKTEIVDRAPSSEEMQLYGIARAAHGAALCVTVPPNHAVMVTARDRRQVIRGPAMHTLAWDESLEVLSLSTGCPKIDQSLLPTCFLQLEGNKVSDVVRVETAGHVSLSLSLSYRVSFVTRDGGPEKWFNVTDYVGLLCDHLGSLLRAAARGATIERFHTDGTEILRRAVLGEKTDGRRAGRMFEENDMWVYDVEVLDISILDDDIAELIGDAQRAAIVAEVDHKKEQIRLAQERLRAEVDCQIDEARLSAAAQRAALERADRLVRVERATSAVEAARVEELGRAQIQADALTAIERARLDASRATQTLALERQQAEVEAFGAQMEALHPELVATLKSLGNQQLAAQLTRNLGPLAILGGDSVVDVAKRLLGSLPLGSDGDEARAVLSDVAPMTQRRSGS